jgi:hypothetical protein
LFEDRWPEYGLVEFRLFEFVGRLAPPLACGLLAGVVPDDAQ